MPTFRLDCTSLHQGNDTWPIIRSGAIEEFHPHIDSIRPSILFTIELDNYGVYSSWTPVYSRCLFDKAEKVTLDDKKLIKERQRLHKVLNANGYPKGFFSRAIALANSSNGKQQDWEPKVTITVRYVASLSEEIRRICNSFDIRMAFRTVRTICSELTRVKDPIPLEK